MLTKIAKNKVWNQSLKPKASLEGSKARLKWKADQISVQNTIDFLKGVTFFSFVDRAKFPINYTSNKGHEGHAIA